MKSINLLSVCLVVVLGVASFVDAVEVDAGFNRLRNLGTGEKPGTMKEKKPKTGGDAKDKVESKGMGKKGSMGGSGNDGGVTAPTPKGGMMSKDPKGKIPKQPESDVPSYFATATPSSTPVPTAN